MPKNPMPSNITLYGIAAGVVLFGGTVVSLKGSLFPEPLAPCTTRYASTIDFPSQTAKAQPISVRDIQTRLGFDEWGLIENVTLEARPVGDYKVVLDVAIAEGGWSKPDKKGRLGGVSFSWKAGLPNTATAACLSYGVRLPDDFDFAQGGILPGIYGGDDPRAGKNGFSTRLAWGQGGGGDIFATLPSTGARGASLAPGAWTFAKGRWVVVEQEVRLNTPGQADGMLAIWIDGELRTELKDVAFRAHGQTRIEGVLADVHYGAPAPAETTIKLTNFNLRWR